MATAIVAREKGRAEGGRAIACLIGFVEDLRAEERIQSSRRHWQGRSCWQRNVGSAETTRVIKFKPSARLVFESCSARLLLPISPPALSSARTSCPPGTHILYELAFISQFPTCFPTSRSSSPSRPSRRWRRPTSVSALFCVRRADS